MIKPEDVRIGNLLRFCSTKNIVVVEWGTILDIVRGNIHYLTKHGPIYEPIPLTHDWLDKFGFHLVDNPAYRMYSNGKIGVHINDNGTFSPSGVKYGVEYSYIHQLQNCIYFIIDEELKIN